MGIPVWCNTEARSPGCSTGMRIRLDSPERVCRWCLDCPKPNRPTRLSLVSPDGRDCLALAGRWPRLRRAHPGEASTSIPQQPLGAWVARAARDKQIVEHPGRLGALGAVATRRAATPALATISRRSLDQVLLWLGLPVVRLGRADFGSGALVRALEVVRKSRENDHPNPC